MWVENNIRSVPRTETAHRFGNANHRFRKQILPLQIRTDHVDTSTNRSLCKISTLIGRNWNSKVEYRFINIEHESDIITHQPAQQLFNLIN